MNISAFFIDFYQITCHNLSVIYNINVLTGTLELYKGYFLTVTGCPFAYTPAYSTSDPESSGLPEDSSPQCDGSRFQHTTSISSIFFQA